MTIKRIDSREERNPRRYSTTLMTAQTTANVKNSRWSPTYGSIFFPTLPEVTPDRINDSEATEANQTRDRVSGQHRESAEQHPDRSTNLTAKPAASVPDE